MDSQVRDITPTRRIQNPDAATPIAQRVGEAPD
jgi:hypothetical protein